MAACLEHLIGKNFEATRQLRILEIGPIGIYTFRAEDNCPIEIRYELEHRAPIAELQRKKPQHKYLGFGHVPADEEIRKSNLGEVPYLQGCLSPFNDESIDTDDRIATALGGRPDIIIGQHVFESSRASPLIMPKTAYHLFEHAARMLASLGFLVVHNYDSGRDDIGERRDAPKHFPHTAQTTLAFAYRTNYSFRAPSGKEEKECIYVFKKM